MVTVARFGLFGLAACTREVPQSSLLLVNAVRDLLQTRIGSSRNLPWLR